MPGDPAQCRLHAARYLALSKRAKNRARRANLAALESCGQNSLPSLSPNKRF
jgi:hypothetical protein